MATNQIKLEEMDLNLFDIQEAIKLRLSRLHEMKESIEKEIFSLELMLGEEKKEDIIKPSLKKFPKKPEQINKIIELLEKDISMAEIVKMTGVSKSTVKKYRNEYFPEKRNIGNKLSKQQVDIIKSLIEDGIRPTKISKDTGINIHTINYYRLKYYPNLKFPTGGNPESSGRVLTEERREKVISLLKENYAICEISEMMNIAPATIGWFVNKFVKKNHPEIKIKSLKGIVNWKKDN